MGAKNILNRCGTGFAHSKEALWTRSEKETKGKRSWHHESWHGSFSRGLPIGRNVEWKKAQAKFKDGILTIAIPKGQNAGENRIKINIQ